MDGADMLVELREILRLIKEITNRIDKLADRIYEEEVNRWTEEHG